VRNAFFEMTQLLELTVETTKPILAIATAGTKKDDPKLRPRIDYLEMQKQIDMNLLNYDVYEKTAFGGILRKLETKIRSDLFLTLLGMFSRQSHQFTFTMSERAGIPFAALQKILPGRVPHISVFTCWSWRQELAIKRLNLFSEIDLIIVKCNALKDHFVALGVPAERIQVIHYGVDQHFFAPTGNVSQEERLILSVGETRTRDYSTLFQAVNQLPVKLAVAASGSWYAREKRTKLTSQIPQNVQLLGKQSLTQLKSWYERCQFVVLPIHDAPFSAGATAVMEAMAMERAVIVTRSEGIADYIIDGETCLTVEPRNPEQMKEAISFLLNHPEEARRLGQNGRKFIEEKLNLDVYVSKLLAVVNCQLSSSAWDA